MGTIDLRKFSAINLERCQSEAGFKHAVGDWSEAEWTNAVAGEAGEACNVAKKILRHKTNVAGNIKPGDMDVNELRLRMAKELADTIIYADLAIQSLGFDTSNIVIETFNAKSEELKCPIKYPVRSAAEQGLLSCECYGGCWGVHSEEWPSIEVGSFVQSTNDFVRIYEIPYGGFVTVGYRLRIHPNYIDRIPAKLKDLWTPYCEDGTCAKCQTGEPCH